MATPNRSAGRLEDVYWDAFTRWARERGLSNSDAQRKMIAEVTGLQLPDSQEPAPPGDDAGS